MDRHAVPRQITTFEFKLVGWFTFKQFGYLLAFAGLSVGVFFVIPVPILDIVMAILTAILGLGLVFFKYNDRTLDTWIYNLFQSLIQPSQYFYRKENEIPPFLKGVYIYADENTAADHIDANKKLSNYMQQTGQKQAPSQKKQEINSLIHSTPANVGQTTAQQGQQTTESQQLDQQNIQPQTPEQAAQEASSHTDSVAHKPFLSGIVRNNDEQPLPNIMIYVNSEAGQVVRILKTNHNGIFATFHPLPSGNFILSPKDLGGQYFFDTMNITIDGPQQKPLEIYSKELL